MFTFIKSFFVLLLLLFTPLTWGWNTYGHMLVSDLAVSKLEPSKQRAFEQLAYSLVKQQDSQKRLYLMRTFEGTSAVAQLSVFPDDWRGRTVAELYAEFGTSLPSALKPYAESTTDSWHYINQAFSYKSQNENAPMCTIDQPENIATMLPVLLDAYEESTSRENKALTLAFILHFVGDAHNPLHTVTKVNEDCESDRGGNLFCVAFHRGSSVCEQNLHQAWDGALGFFDEHEKVADAVHFVSYVEVQPDAAAILDPNEWVAEGYGMAHLVYSAKDGEELDPYYVDEGKIISYELLALSAARLAAILDSL